MTGSLLVFIAQWKERPSGSREVIGLISVGDLDFLCLTLVLLINSPFIYLASLQPTSTKRWPLIDIKLRLGPYFVIGSYRYGGVELKGQYKNLKNYA